ncbi:unnamed protein product [Bursaphelenchus xylophilus]|uniref:(pine wood nematode) hypothetical protein n=1 Tax=Bursaphelenchus xylophilus TaxID=6326 RepID=A0A1I7SQU4_BURXY|nr:unnamed protein product [Bursaphelenchus xylophilus]CAG9110396.1 unnamed protein product [Bursaphelenchus xylophilus]
MFVPYIRVQNPLPLLFIPAPFQNKAEFSNGAGSRSSPTTAHANLSAAVQKYLFSNRGAGPSSFQLLRRSMAHRVGAFPRRFRSVQKSVSKNPPPFSFLKLGSALRD